MKRMYAIEIDIDKWTSARWYLITMSMMKLLKYECVLFQMVFDEHIGHWVAIYEKLDFDENYGALCHKVEDCSFWIFLCSLGDRLKMELDWWILLEIFLCAGSGHVKRTEEWCKTSWWK